MSNTDIVTKVTADLIAELEGGVVPWHQPWKGGTYNRATGKGYRGINVWILAAAARRHRLGSGGWLTFKQAQGLGGAVRAGEKGTAVVFWKLLSTDDETTVPLLRYYTVFHESQCDGLPEAPVPVTGAVADADVLIAAYRDRPVVQAGDAAFYRPSTDTVTIPDRGAFESLAAYYHTLFHEFAHSTGHESRLKRPEVVKAERFGTESYAVEELTAELTAAYCCTASGLDTATIKPAASYLASWLRVLKAEPRLLLTASGRAQKAFDYIAGTTPEADA